MKRATRPSRLRLLAVLIAVLAPVSMALAKGVPASLRGAILAKALGYEKSLQKGSGTVVIAVIGPRAGAGASDASNMAAALAKMTRGGVAGRGAKVIRITDSDASTAAASVRAKGAQVAYVADGLADASGVSKTLAKERRLVLCGDPSNVGKGCILSVEPKGSASQLVVDVTGAKQAGYEFDARMLRLARVVR